MFIIAKLAVLICGFNRKISKVNKSHEFGHEGILSVAEDYLPCNLITIR